MNDQADKSHKPVQYGTSHHFGKGISDESVLMSLDRIGSTISRNIRKQFVLDGYPQEKYILEAESTV